MRTLRSMVNEFGIQTGMIKPVACSRAIIPAQDQAINNLPQINFTPYSWHIFKAGDGQFVVRKFTHGKEGWRCYEQPSEAMSYQAAVDFCEDKVLRQAKLPQQTVRWMMSDDIPNTMHLKHT